MAEKRTIELEIQDNSKSLKAQYREAVAELQKVSAAYGETSEQAVKAAKAAADLKDQIEFSKDLVDSFNPDAKFNALTRSVGGALDGFQAYEGALGLMGVESEKLQETMVKLQSIMALTQGLQGVMEAKDSFKQLGTVVTDAFGKMTASSKAFMITGIGLLVAGLGLLVANWDKVKAATNAQTAAQKVSNQVTAQATAAIANEISAADKLSRQLKTETLTRAEKLQKVKEFQAAYPGLLKNVNLETMSIAQINSQLEKNIQLLRLQAEVKAIEAIRSEKLQTKIKTQLDELSISQENATNWTLDYGETAANGWIGFSSASENAAKAQKKFTDIQTTGTKQIDKDIIMLDKQSLAVEKQIAALQKQGAQVGDNNSGVQDFSKNVASFTTATNTNTSSIDRQREALEKLNDLKQRISQAEQEYLTSLLSQQEQEKKAVTDKYADLIREADKYNQDSMLLREAMEKGLADIDKKYADLATEEKKKNEEAKLAAERAAIDKANTEYEKGLSDRFQAELLIAKDQDEELLNQRKTYQDQLDKLNELYAKGAITSQQEYNTALQNIEEDNQKKQDEIKEKYNKKDIERQNLLRQKTLQLAGNTFSALADLAGSFNTKNEKDARKQFQIQKAFNLGAAITNTAMAVTGALTAGGNPIKLATGQQFVEAAIAATIGAANIIKIANSKFGGGGSSSSGGGGGSNAPASSPMTANFNTIGSSGINQLAQLQQTPTQAYVVSGEVTSAQALDRNRVQNATL
jgi:hypothetical protein